MGNNLTMLVQIKNRKYPSIVESTASVILYEPHYKNVRLNEIINQYLKARNSNLDLLPFLIINVVYLDFNGEVVEKELDTRVQL